MSAPITDQSPSSGRPVSNGDPDHVEMPDPRTSPKTTRAPSSRQHEPANVRFARMSEDTRLHAERTGHSFRPRLPRRSIRVRLAVLFFAVFVASGAVLLAVTAAAWRSRTGDSVARAVPVPAGQNPAAGITQHGSDRHQLVIASAIALAIMALVSLAVG